MEELLKDEFEDEEFNEDEFIDHLVNELNKMEAEKRL